MYEFIYLFYYKHRTQARLEPKS